MMSFRVACLALLVALAAGAQVYDVEYPTKDLTTPGGEYMPYGPCSSGFIVGRLEVIEQAYIEQCLVTGSAVLVDDDGNPSHVEFEGKQGYYDRAVKTCTFDVFGTEFVTNYNGSWVESDDCAQESSVALVSDDDSPGTFYSDYRTGPRVVGKMKIKQQRNGKMKFWYTLLICAFQFDPSGNSTTTKYFGDNECVLRSVKSNKPGPSKPFVQHYNSTDQDDEDTGVIAYLYNRGRKTGYRQKKKGFNAERYGAAIGVRVTTTNRASDDMKGNGGDKIYVDAAIMDTLPASGHFSIVTKGDLEYSTAFERVAENKKTIVKRKKIKDWTGGKKVDGKWVYPNAILSTAAPQT
jgi:hypothetical protein